MADPVISVDDLGVEFYRSRRRRIQLRVWLLIPWAIIALGGLGRRR